MNVAAYFAVRATEIWLTQRLMLIGALVVTMCACSITIYSNKGYEGLALSYSLNIVVNLNMSVRNAAEVEAMMVAVERLLEYVKIAEKKGMGDGRRTYPVVRIAVQRKRSETPKNPPRVYIVVYRERPYCRGR
jgi:hypothetical protein